MDIFVAFLATAVEVGHVDVAYLANRMEELIELIEIAFEKASTEPKIMDRKTLLESNSRPIDSGNRDNELSHIQAFDIEQLLEFTSDVNDKKILKGKKAMGASDVMRKHMTTFFDEQLEKNPSMMYIGEDVEHGG